MVLSDGGVRSANIKWRHLLTCAIITCSVVIALAMVICITNYICPRSGQIEVYFGGKRDTYIHRVENESMIFSGVVKFELNRNGISGFINEFPFTDPKLERRLLRDEKYFKIDRKVPYINCNKLFAGDATELELAHNLTLTQPILGNISAKVYATLTSDCPRFREKRGYVLSSLTKLEEEFPIAFSLLLFKDVEQSERLLRAIYRPQNYYCIHVDLKADVAVYNAMKNISDCFENVFMTYKRFDVQWGHMSVLEPELACMTQLWTRSKKWKYFINLTGQEFPLRTNYELVKILTAYNGANDVEGTIRWANLDRWVRAGPTPQGIIPVKGSVHVTVNRDYVDYVIHSDVARNFLKWLKHVWIPDELFFASLNHNPSLGIKGSYKGLPETDHTDIKPFMTRFKNWENGAYGLPCHGKRVRSVCVFGTGDLRLLATRPELFANKFHLYYHHFALDCMEELHFNNTRDEYMGKMAFDSRYYAELGFVKNKVT